MILAEIIYQYGGANRCTTYSIEIKANEVSIGFRLWVVHLRASMIVVINYIWEQIDKCIDRIDINDFIWSKGQDKTKQYKPYHLTRTTSY